MGRGDRGNRKMQNSKLLCASGIMHKASGVRRSFSLRLPNYKGRLFPISTQMLRALTSMGLAKHAFKAPMPHTWNMRIPRPPMCSSQDPPNHDTARAGGALTGRVGGGGGAQGVQGYDLPTGREEAPKGHKNLLVNLRKTLSNRNEA